MDRFQWMIVGIIAVFFISLGALITYDNLRAAPEPNIKCHTFFVSTFNDFPGVYIGDI